MEKNLLALWETWVWCLDWENPLEEGPIPVLLTGESHGQRSLVATVHGVTRNWTQLSDWAHTHCQSHEVTLELPSSVTTFPGAIPLGHCITIMQFILHEKGLEADKNLTNWKTLQLNGNVTGNQAGGHITMTYLLQEIVRKKVSFFWFDNNTNWM